ncbi:MAG: 1-acyl-sn-glycerol-3-phosphate acyltransferase [Bacilli bacterium]|nr:1-acyl-sn-glycerol-3-phosphate acyltransferase [Bacilli bacterium]MCK9309789.1 1-acyl-sn-glycerol-3-phosphate acyltransferase [Candidatus Cloacimonadota bacterium]
MLKYIRVIFTFGLYLLFSYPKILYYYINRKKIPFDKRYDYILGLFKKLEKSFKINYIVKGIENVPENGKVVFCPNHQSYLDPLILSLVNQKACPVAKIETKRMPFIGKISAIMGALYLDRENLKASYKTIKEATDLLNNNIDLLIFLEGTRSKNHDRSLNEFKPGGLKPIYNSGATIVPVALDGYYNCLDIKKKQLVNDVHVTFLKPISYEEYKNVSNFDLVKRMHDDIEKEIAKVHSNEK